MKNTRVYLGLRKLWVGYKLVFKPYSYLNLTGFIKSHQYIEPIDAQGNPIPWLNYAIIDFLNERLHNNLNMFEYGAGFSTQYFAKRINHITAIEYDGIWVDKVKNLLAEVKNATLLIEAVNEAYIHAAVKTNTLYDVILVDGRERVACVRSAVSALSASGVLILDDSNRAEYKESFEIMRHAGYRYLTFTGLKPFSFKIEHTTIFYKDGNSLKI